ILPFFGCWMQDSFWIVQTNGTYRFAPFIRFFFYFIRYTLTILVSVGEGVHMRELKEAKDNFLKKYLQSDCFGIIN
ncbi:MAG: hypothetical protein WBP21_09240, partial [Trichococcus flocculiformis]